MMHINYLYMTRYLLIVPVFVVMTGCSAAPREAQSETSLLNEWLDEIYEEQLQMSPMRLTMLGRKDQYDRIDDMSEEAGDRRLAWQKETVSQMQKQFNYDELDRDGRLSYDLWSYQFEIAEAGHEFRRHHYVFDQMRSLHTQLPNFLINFHKVDDVSDMKAYIARIEGVSGAIYQLLERSERQADEDIRWTEEVAVRYMSENSTIADGAIRAEIRRYMVIPGQATAYKIGMIKIEELRSHAEQELGERFDIREFHDTILGGGSMPLHLLEQQVNRWIGSRRAG